MKCKFPSKLKLADITARYKNGNLHLLKIRDQLVSCLWFQKSLRELWKKQIVSYIDEYLSPFLCGYRKGYSTQYALLGLIEKWKKMIDNQGYSGAVLMDLSKAFDTINDELLLAKFICIWIWKTNIKIT